MNYHDNCIGKAIELINELHEHVRESNAVIEREIKRCNRNEWRNKSELVTLLNRSNSDVTIACELILTAAENCLSDDYVSSMILDPSNYGSHKDADEEDSPVDSEEPEQICKIIDYSTKSVIT